MQIHFLPTERYQFSEQEQTKIKNIIGHSYDKAKQLLPMLSEQLNITVQPSTKVIPETGEGAVANHQDWINVHLNPDFKKGLDWIIDNHLHGTVLHESHHCTRYKNPGSEESLLGNAIFEGLATVFERDYAQHLPLWGDYSEVPIKEWTEELLAHKNEAAFHYPHWFFNSNDGRRWIGYRVGTYIVDQALKNYPEETPATLVHTSVDDIMEMADQTLDSA